MNALFDISSVNVIFLKTLRFLKTNKRFLSFTNFGEKQSEGKQAFIFFLFWSLYSEPPMFYSDHEFTIYISVGLCLPFGYLRGRNIFKEVLNFLH